jgi:hypothetical protein
MRNWSSFVLVVTGLVSSWIAFFPSRADAFGAKGHELVGKIADKLLSRKARTAIDDLLHDHKFQSLSDGRLTNWADSIKTIPFFKTKYPKNSQWHFIDVDVKADLATLKLESFCPNGDCALDRIKLLRTVLKNPANTIQDRREALFFIAHFIGDIHQPLHCAERNNDRGGNNVKVKVEGDSHHITNLHSVWDTELVEDAIGSFTLEDFATRLTNSLSATERKKIQSTSLEEWILEGHKLARSKVYKDKGMDIPETGPGVPHELSAEYVTEGADLIEEQLTKGGARLAKYLNDTFKD